jgi:hypothetical protein
VGIYIGDYSTPFVTKCGLTEGREGEDWQWRVVVFVGCCSDL